MLLNNSTSTNFSLSADSESLFRILSDTLYSQKELAVVRELSTNALDANRMIGNEGIPIRVTVPTYAKRVFSVRDFGPGLSEEEVYNIYTKYGESTKKTADNMTGFMGVGSKSPFAVAEMFTITSYHGGNKSSYIAKFLQGMPAPTIEKIAEEPSEEPTGLEIVVPAKQDKLNDWRDAASRIYSFFDVQPEFTSDFQFTEKLELIPIEAGLFALKSHTGGYSATRGVFARMGQIAYPVDIRTLQIEYPASTIFSNAEPNLVIDFGPRELDFSANREQLAYTAKTIAALTVRLNEVITLIINKAVSMVVPMATTREISANYLMLSRSKAGIFFDRIFRFRTDRNLVEQFRATLREHLPNTNLTAIIASESNFHIIRKPRRITKSDKIEEIKMEIGKLSEAVLIKTEVPMRKSQIIAWLRKEYSGSTVVFMFVAEKDSGTYKQDDLHKSLTEYAAEEDFAHVRVIPKPERAPKVAKTTPEKDAALAQRKLYFINEFGAKDKRYPNCSDLACIAGSTDKASMQLMINSFRTTFPHQKMPTSAFVFAATKDIIEAEYKRCNMAVPPTRSELAASLLDQYRVTTAEEYARSIVDRAGSVWALAEEEGVIDFFLAKGMLPKLEKLRSYKVPDDGKIRVSTATREYQYLAAGIPYDDQEKEAKYLAQGSELATEILTEINAACPEIALYTHLKYASDEHKRLLTNLIKR